LGAVMIGELNPTNANATARNPARLSPAARIAGQHQCMIPAGGNPVP
jgi:hypothetical protein